MQYLAEYFIKAWADSQFFQDITLSHINNFLQILNLPTKWKYKNEIYKNENTKRKHNLPNEKVSTNWGVSNTYLYFLR